MRHLHERLDDFTYGYRMRCDCGAVVRVAAETYHREQSVEARVSCVSCGGQVHFGPAVALLRDENDPALDNESVCDLAWYHSSTWPDWPSPKHVTAAATSARRAARQFGLDSERAVHLATTKALHVGTYEAAIENMLRRMHDQADGGSEFYLYRVAIRVAPNQINDGYREERAEAASQLTVAELDESGLDAIRYVNVYEACGSLSVALRPECLDAVQRVAIPIPDLAHQPTAALARSLERLSEQHQIWSEEVSRLPVLDEQQRVEMRLHGLLGEGRVASQFVDLERRGYDLWDEISRTLAAAYLGDISPVIADDFRQAMDAWCRAADPTPIGFADRFASIAALLTRGGDVVGRAAAQGARTLGGL